MEKKDDKISNTLPQCLTKYTPSFPFLVSQFCSPAWPVSPGRVMAASTRVAIESQPHPRPGSVNDVQVWRLGCQTCSDVHDSCHSPSLAPLPSSLPYSSLHFLSSIHLSLFLSVSSSSTPSATSSFHLLIPFLFSFSQLLSLLPSLPLSLYPVHSLLLSPSTPYPSCPSLHLFLYSSYHKNDITHEKKT